MNESDFMDGVNGQGSFCNVELRHLFWQSIFFHKESHHIPTRQKLHNEV